MYKRLTNCKQTEARDKKAQIETQDSTSKTIGRLLTESKNRKIEKRKSKEKPDTMVESGHDKSMKTGTNVNICHDTN